MVDIDNHRSVSKDREGILMAKFEHEVLTDMSSEERWLKFFPRKVFMSAVAKVFLAIIAIYLFGLKKETIIFSVFMLLWAGTWAALSVIEKSPNSYRTGGGLTLTDLFWKKIHFKRNKKRYTLGADNEKEILRYGGVEG